LAAGTIDSSGDGHLDRAPVAVVVAAHNEADRIVETLAGLRSAFPTTALWVADDGSGDATAELADSAGARVVSVGRVAGKGQAMTLAARQALVAHPGREDDVFLLCDGDLGESAARLDALVVAVKDAGDASGGEQGSAWAAASVRPGSGVLAVAVFVRSVGGGFGIALRFARWTIRSGCGLQTRAPISGQRAITRGALEAVLPFAQGYGMEVGMTIDAVRAGARLVEVEVDLSHRASGRTVAGFAHRARQLLDFARAYLRRR
jgi:Glycosyl transferase family 2